MKKKIEKKTKKKAEKKTVKKAVKKAKKKVQGSEELVKVIVDGIQDKKGEKIISLDLREIKSSVCDFFIICEGNSRTQVDAIAGSVEERVKKTLSERPYHSEGYGNAEWILIDYVTVIVHVFQPQIRSFYNIEGLWADADTKRIA